MRTARATAGHTRFSSHLLSVLLAAAGVAGCAGTRTTAQLPLITLRLEEGARWLEPRDLPRYRCAEGALICTSSDGRLSTRLCRCVPQVRSEGNPTSSPQRE
jgi:hypothetical protein